MTKREREQVAELLRCAADYIARGMWDEGGALSMAATELDVPWFKFAYEAECRAWLDMNRAGTPCTHYRIDSLLEAAQRVEEGSYP